MINNENITEFVEALELEDFVSDDEVLEIIQDLNSGEEVKEAPYNILKEKLYHLIVEKKKLPFGKLVNQHYSLPLDRVTKFLEMLEDDIKYGERTQVKDFFLNEIKFVQKKIGQLNMFDASVEDTHKID